MVFGVIRIFIVFFIISYFLYDINSALSLLLEVFFITSVANINKTKPN